MQDLQPINGSRVLLKRLVQQQPQQQLGNLQMQHPSLKCPRCDSLNTKFCYYNNYNLSQPRHFCKNCRRYWTKGGVLRNIPVGGGCRKSKRSSSSSSSKLNKSSSSITTCKNGQNSHSSSDTSSATAAVGGDRLFQISEVENFGMSSDLFSGQIEGFMGLINNNNNNNNTVAVNERNGNVSTASFSEFLQSQEVQEWDMGKIFGGVHEGEEKIGSAINLIDHTVTIEDLLQNKGSNVGLTTLDWHNEGSMFDVADADHNHHQGCYWDESTVDIHHDSQWSDSTTSHFPLFLPP